MKKMIMILVATMFVLSIIGGCTTHRIVQNPIEKARTDSVLDKMEDAYGAPKYRFQYLEIDGKMQMIEHYYYKLDDNNTQVVKVVNGKLQAGDNIETD